MSVPENNSVQALVFSLMKKGPQVVVDGSLGVIVRLPSPAIRRDSMLESGVM